MKLIDFIKDKMAYIVAYFTSTSLAILIICLSVVIKFHEFSWHIVLYAYIVSSVIFIMLMLYEYSKVRLFYKQLNEMYRSDDILDSILNIGQVKTNEHEFFKKLLKKVHSFFAMKVGEYEENQKQYSYFINQWVHQMKTPVSIINLILQDETSEQLQDVLESIGEENEKIAQGLNIMLYNARINEFNHDFNVEVTDMMEIIREIINDSKKLLIHQGIFPKVTGEKILVETDRKWISFVINQIVVNAIKYTSAAKREKKIISFNLKEDNEKVVLSIEDNGIGIPKEDLSRVFNAFFTGKNGRKTSESTGMGMYLAKRICTELGHGIKVESEEGQGTEFSIIFYKGKNIFKV